MKWAPLGASITPSTNSLGILRVWTLPSFRKSSVGIIFSQLMNVRLAAFAKRSSKYKSGPKNCPFPWESALFI